MEIKEPAIEKDKVLILEDDNFNAEHVCIVTGVGTGIGRATAVAAAANKLMTVGVDINEEEGKKTQKMARDMGGQMIFIKADLTKDDLMQRIMLRAPFYLAKLTIPYMKKSSDGSGAIGNIGSVHAHLCTLNKPVYNITKFGLRALSQSISAEGEGKVRSFTVSTGFVKTPLALNQIPAQAKQRGITPEEVVTEVMMGRSRIKEMMSPIEVGNLFVFGFSRFARYLVGGDLLFDGGMVLTY
jgi:3-hydroxybutyrate dehydrogenase